MDEFDVELQQRGSDLWVLPTGDLDLQATADFREALTLATSSDAAAVVVDLRGLEFLDSTGLGVLLQTCAGPEGARVRLVRGTPQVQRVIAISGLEPELPFIDGD